MRATSAPASPRTRSTGSWRGCAARDLELRSPRPRRCRRFERTTSSGSSRLVAEVEFGEWTHDGRLRAPVYKGLREDKEPEEVRREEALPGEIRRGKRAQALQPRQAFLAGGGHHEGRPDRVLPRRCAGARPHLRDRPFTMKRYPDGWQGKHFFQKDAPRTCPTGFRPSSTGRPRVRRARSGRSATRSSTTSSGSSGWRTWAAST